MAAAPRTMQFPAGDVLVAVTPVGADLTVEATSPDGDRLRITAMLTREGARHVARQLNAASGDAFERTARPPAQPEA